jgi:lipid II:glycine glycyltransferase (peptidoglycan interpeptide bridge formation enzyme)
MSHFWLDQKVMAELGFSVYPGVTHLLKLPENEADTWNMLKSSARNRIRKAEDNSLVVEKATDDSIVKHFYEQFIEVYGKQGMVTPFSEDRPRSLFKHLYAAGALLPLFVKYKDEVIATGLFPYDEKCIYFWGAASWLKNQKLCPNELLHWHVIKFAVDNRIRAYNMCGGTSQFKNKFGGDDVPYMHYSKSALPFMQQARNWYKNRHFRALKK